MCEKEREGEKERERARGRERKKGRKRERRKIKSEIEAVIEKTINLSGSCAIIGLLCIDRQKDFMHTLYSLRSRPQFILTLRSPLFSPYLNDLRIGQIRHITYHA